MTEEELNKIADLVVDKLEKRGLVIFIPKEDKKCPTKPSTPYPSHPFPDPVPLIDIKQTCSKCGLDISGPIGYVCSQLDCPCGLGPTQC